MCMVLFPFIFTFCLDFLKCVQCSHYPRTIGTMVCLSQFTPRFIYSPQFWPVSNRNKSPHPDLLQEAGCSNASPWPPCFLPQFGSFTSRQEPPGLSTAIVNHPGNWQKLSEPLLLEQDRNKEGQRVWSLLPRRWLT